MSGRLVQLRSDRSGQVRSGGSSHVRSINQFITGHPDKVTSGQVIQVVQVRSGLVHVGQVRSSQFRSDQVRSSRLGRVKAD